MDNRPVSVEGVFLPSKNSIVKGATWTCIFHRNLLYRTRDNNSKIIDEQVNSIQTDRAIVTGIEKVIVPAGIFEKAVKVEWSGRIEMEADGGRKILKPLTARPFRKDIMWFAPGIGLVKRRIVYSALPNKNVTFVLEKYIRP
jgi:hypothetical protein